MYLFSIEKRSYYYVIILKNINAFVQNDYCNDFRKMADRFGGGTSRSEKVLEVNS